MASTQSQDKILNYLEPQAKEAVQAFDALGTDEQLALLYYLYQKMGDSITPAAPTAADPNLSPTLLVHFYELSDEQQLNTMRAIARREDTEHSRYYGALGENNRLLVWYAWAQNMGNTVVDLPKDYQATSDSQNLLKKIENLDFQEQISVLRAVAANMGYSDVKPIPTQEQTGKTDSL